MKKLLAMTKTGTSFINYKFLLVGFSFVLLFGTQACKNTKSEFSASGTFEATEIIVSSEANGKILDFNIQEGNILKTNQVVGYIDSIQLYLKKLQLLANFKTIESRRPNINVQIASIKQQIATAKTEKLRIENLLKANAANQKQLDDINAQILLLQKQLNAQISTLENTSNGIGGESSAIEIQVAQLNDQLQKCKITSPINGTVLVKYAEKGELATQGKPLFKIADLSNIILRVYITGNQLPLIKLNQQVKVLTDNGKGEYKETDGVVSWINDKAEFTPKTIQTRDERANMVYAVKINVKNDGTYKIGMYGGINLEEEN